MPNNLLVEDQPMVSVLMTAYNREKYVGDAIQSVLSSTYQNLELIVVDDLSTDHTVQIASEFASRDGRVKVYVNEKNLGDYPNRNKAAGYANGKYLKYVDSDDYIYPWGLELLVGMMERFPQAGWGLCSLEQDGKRPFPFELTPKEAYEYNYRGPGLFHKAPLSSIIKKEVFEEAGGFLPGRMVSDFEMWHRLALKYPVVLMPSGILWSREHEGQEMSSHHQFIIDYHQIMIRYLKSGDCPLDPKTVSNILKEKSNMIFWYMLRRAAKLDIQSVHSGWKTWRAYN
jgi:glycosyltransferase involved in cell wall biosynthesis